MEDKKQNSAKTKILPYWLRGHSIENYDFDFSVLRGHLHSDFYNFSF